MGAAVFLELKVVGLVLVSAVVIGTAYRLYIRRWRIWWDDGFAFIGTAGFLVQLAALFVHVHDVQSLSRLTRVAGYYMIAMSFYFVTWTARLSIIFSVIRIDPSSYRRKKLYFCVVLFVLAFIMLSVQLFLECEPQPNWKNQDHPQCKLTDAVAWTQFATDIVADSILLWAPLKILSGLEDRGLRRRLKLIFSTCIATTIASLVHSIFILKAKGAATIVVATIENCISLTVCNLPIIIAVTLRLRSHYSSYGDSTERTGVPRSTFLSFASLGFRHSHTYGGGLSRTSRSNSHTSEEDGHGHAFTVITLPTTTIGDSDHHCEHHEAGSPRGSKDDKREREHEREHPADKDIADMEVDEDGAEASKIGQSHRRTESHPRRPSATV